MHAYNHTNCAIRGMNSANIRGMFKDQFGVELEFVSPFAEICFSRLKKLRSSLSYMNRAHYYYTVRAFFQLYNDGRKARIHKAVSLDNQCE